MWGCEDVDACRDDLCAVEGELVEVRVDVGGGKARVAKGVDDAAVVPGEAGGANVGPPCTARGGGGGGGETYSSTLTGVVTMEWFAMAKVVTWTGCATLTNISRASGTPRVMWFARLLMRSAAAATEPALMVEAPSRTMPLVMVSGTLRLTL